MQFQVPQFIEIEDKIIGPFSFRQFVYVVGGAGLAFVIFTFVPRLIALPLIAIVLAFAAALAFYRFNNKPFVDLVESMLRYFMNSRLYIWKKEARKPTPQEQASAEVESVVSVPRLSDSRLRELSWSLDVHDAENPLG